ncbi:MAG: hypothetical protein JXA44_00230 [Methanospirillaceae archaeon]|nr:hypothetical protein [Methanospirillaceae archaeon]
MNRSNVPAVMEQMSSPSFTGAQLPFPTRKTREGGSTSLINARTSRIPSGIAIPAVLSGGGQDLSRV